MAILKGLPLKCLVIVLVTLSKNGFCQKITGDPKQVIFQHSAVIERNIDSMANEMFDAKNFLTQQDSQKVSFYTDTMSLVFKEMFTEFLLQSIAEEKKTIISIDKDTIWRYTLINEKIVGDFERIDRNGKIYKHARVNKGIQYDSSLAFNKNNAGEMKIYRDDTAMILGYKCFKIVFTSNERFDEDLPFQFGDQVVEMYVTEDIQIPAHAIVYLDKPYSFFPLSIKMHSQNFSIVEWQVATQVIK